jgi:hypothetical protein
VKVRDAAVLARVSRGAATFEQLVDAMPVEAGQSDSERIDDCARTIMRLVVKKRVRGDTGEGYTAA